MIKERDFLASIEKEEDIDKVDPEKIVVPPNYEGPSIEMN